MQAVPVTEDVGKSARGPNEVDLTGCGGFCTCFSMQDIGLSCCLANTCFSPCTYYYTAKYLGVSDNEALTAAVLLLCQGEFPALKCCSVYCGFQNRKEMKKNTAPLKMPDDIGDNPCFRCCCEGWVVCQENDAALQVAKRRAGEGATYGSVGALECCMMVDGKGERLSPKLKVPYRGVVYETPAALPSLGALSR